MQRIGYTEDTANSEKYSGSGKIGRLLIDTFYDNCACLISSLDGKVHDVLEIGIAEGISTQYLRASFPSSVHYEASEFLVSRVLMAQERNPDIPIRQESIYELKRKDKSFDMVICLEVLEHLEDPQKALSEISRVASKYALISTPREPIWRILNMCRGKYWSRLGNTPAHIQNWSSQGLIEQTEAAFEVLEMKQPLPWTLLLLKPTQ